MIGMGLDALVAPEPAAVGDDAERCADDAVDDSTDVGAVSILHQSAGLGSPPRDELDVAPALVVVDGEPDIDGLLPIGVTAQATNLGPGMLSCRRLQCRQHNRQLEVHAGAEQAVDLAGVAVNAVDADGDVAGVRERLMEDLEPPAG